MSRILISPSRYVQGAGELERIASYTVSLGKKPLVLASASGLKRIGDAIKKSFAEYSIEPVFDAFSGECTTGEISRVALLASENGCDFIIGCGGGKALDTVKAAAFENKTPAVVCPTIASTDAPCSALAVIYKENGQFESYRFFPKNPDLVLVDTSIIAKAPARLLVSGMGDALATWFEARAAVASGSDTCAGGKATKAALAIARLCYDTLLADGLKAKLALEAGACTTAVESIIEANTLLSGLGFESCGLAAAHAIHDGMTALPECHHLYHGEKVAFGTLTQLALEDAPLEEYTQVLHFARAIGLPTTFAELGITDTSREHLLPVAELSMAEGETMKNMPFAVSPEMVLDAMYAADAMSQAL